jgi:hypothetical protein
MNITIEYTIKLDEWLEASRAHRSPISTRPRRSWPRIIGFVCILLVFLLFIVLLNVGSSPATKPGQSGHYFIDPSMLPTVMPQLICAGIVCTVLLFSAPTYRKASFWATFPLIVFAVTLAIVSAYFERETSSRPPPDQPVSVLGLLPLVSWLLMVLATWLAVIGVLRRSPQLEWKGNPSLRNLSSTAITESGLATVQQDRNLHWQWKAFIKFRETKNLILLYLSENSILPIPKHVFNPADLAAFLDLLQHHVASAVHNSTAFAVIPKPLPPPPHPVHVQLLESREFM